MKRRLRRVALMWLLGTLAIGCAPGRMPETVTKIGEEEAAPISAMSELKAGEIAFLRLSRRYWQVWVMAGDGSNARQVTSSVGDKTSVSWFPDGRALLATNMGGGALHVDLEDGSETTVELPLQRVRDVVVSPGGGEIAFGFDPGDSIDASEIFTAVVGGTELTQLSNMKGFQHLPKWGPAGRWIYFSSGSDPMIQNIMKIAAGGGTPIPVIFGLGHNFFVDVRADGAVLVSSNRTGNYDIWLHRVGEEPLPLTTAVARDSAPSWTGSGTGVVYESSTGGQLDLWWVPAVGGTPKRLTSGEGGARRPVWGKGSSAVDQSVSP